MQSDQIHLRSLRVECIVGVRPEERRREQPVEVDLSLDLDLSMSAHDGRISTTCNYDRLADEVATLLRFRRYRLLEMAAEEVAAMVLGVHRVVQRVTVAIHKPRALQGRAQAASIVISREQSRYPRRYETTEFGEAEIVLENTEAGLYLLHVAPGNVIPRHHHQVMRELEWLVRGQLERDGKRLVGFQPVTWRHGETHSYRNVGAKRATLFCCDVPAFDRTDEIVERDEEWA